MSGGFRGRWPVPADFAAPPTDARRRGPGTRPTGPPGRRASARLRARFADAGVDAYFGVRREHMRYLTGFTLGEGEEKVAGNSGQFLVGGDDVVVLADSRYTIQARREAPRRRIVEAYNDLPSRWPELVASVGARRVAVEAGFVSHAAWERLAAAAPDVELVAGRRLGRGGPRRQGAGRDRTDRGRLRGRRPGPRRAAARDPAGRRPRPSSRSASNG